MDADEATIAASTAQPFPLWPFVSVTLQAAAAFTLAEFLLGAAYAIGSAMDPDLPRLEISNAGSLGLGIFRLFSYFVMLMTIVPRLPHLAQRSLGEMLHAFRGRDWRVFGGLFALQIGLGFATAKGLALFHQAAHVQAGYEHLAFASPFAFVVFALNAVVAAPFAEEFFFRGLLFAGLAARMPWVAAGCISALLFGLLHGDLIFLPIISITGFLNAVAYQRTGNLAVSIALHASDNSVYLLLLHVR